MATRYLGAGALALLAALASPLSTLAQQPPAASAQNRARPIPPGRVFVWDIEGTWISQTYLQRLQATRSPHAAGTQVPPLIIKVQREERVYPIVVTDFHNAVMQFLIEIEPAGKPGAYRMVVAPEEGMVSATDVTYVPFRGDKNAEGKFDTLSIADPFFSKRKFVAFVRLTDALEAHVNRTVIAGKYQDREGRTYEFTQSGDAVLPDRSFPYEVVLDAKAGNCDLLHSDRERAPEGKERLGFAWKGAELQLFNTKPLKGERYACEAKPFAVLTPQSST